LATPAPTGFGTAAIDTGPKTVSGPASSKNSGAIGTGTGIVGVVLPVDVPPVTPELDPMLPPLEAPALVEPLAEPLPLEIPPLVDPPVAPVPMPVTLAMQQPTGTARAGSKIAKRARTLIAVLQRRLLSP
jgi:hypothetical protein